MKIGDKLNTAGDVKLSNPEINLFGIAINNLRKTDADQMTVAMQDQINQQIKAATEEAEKQRAGAAKK